MTSLKVILDNTLEIKNLDSKKFIIKKQTTFDLSKPSIYYSDGESTKIGRAHV